MKQSNLITENKLLIALIAFILILSIILIPGINKYVHEYNAMSQELNRLGFKIDEISLEPETKTIATTIQPKVIEKQVIKNDNQQVQPITIDYKPLENAVDAAIGVEDIGDNTPFAKPEPNKVKPELTSKKIIETKPIKKIQQVNDVKINKKPLVVRTSKTKIQYAVQMASFTNKTSAYKFKEKLIKLKLNTKVTKQKNLYKVLIIPETNNKIAAKSLQQSVFKKYKINGYVNKIKL